MLHDFIAQVGKTSQLCMYANLGVCEGEWHSNMLARLTRTYAQRPRRHTEYLQIILDSRPGQQAIRPGISHSPKNAIREHSLARQYATTCIGIDFLTILREDSRRRVGKSMSRVLAACSRMCQHKCPYCSVQGFTETSKEICADA